MSAKPRSYFMENERIDPQKFLGPLILAWIASCLICAIIACLGVLFLRIPYDDLQPVTAPSNILPCPGVPAGWEHSTVDDFGSSSQFYWPDLIYHRPGFEWRLEADALRAYITGSQRNPDWVYRSATYVRDFYLQADIKQLTGPVKSHYGIVFHSRENLGGERYAFVINGSQQYAIWHKDPYDWNTIVDWKQSSLIKVDGSNQLVVLGEGNRYTVCINGQTVDSFEDESLPSGGIGFQVGMNADGDSSFEFDRLEIFQP